MVHALPVHPQDSRSFRELLVDCEVRAMASRIANASYNFFATIVLSIIRGCSQLKDRVVEFIDPKIKFTNSLLKIPTDQRKSVASHALSIISPTMPADTKDAFIRAIDESSDDTLGKNLSSLITPEMYSQENIKTIETIAAVPAPERKDLISNAVQLIAPHMSADGGIEIIQSLASVPVNERDLVTTLTLQVVPQETGLLLYSIDRGDVIRAIAAIAAPEREDVIRNAVQLITPGMLVINRIKIIQSLASVPVNERGPVTALAIQVTAQEKMRLLYYREDHIRGDVIRAIAAIAAPEREDVIRNAVQLITPHGYAGDIVEIIKILASVPVNERGLLTALALQVVTQVMMMGPSHRVDVIKAIAAIAASEREDVIRNAVRLITPRRFAEDMVGIIESLASVPANERDLVTTLALQVVTQQMGLFNVEFVIGAIAAIAAIAAPEREDVIRNAVRLITPYMYENDRLRMIRMVAGVHAAERANFVENRRRGRHHRQPAVAARFGVNVHEGNRDQRTRDALDLLRRHQGVIAPARIREAKEAFVVYLENSRMEQAQRQLAKDALSKPRGDREDFGPLISDTGFSILGFKLTGEELIGRLWIYASSLKGDEKTNAKVGMISALIKSYEGNSRVCNQGKTQRLVVAVLQGRLAGVNLEGEIVPEQVPKHQALTMFFNIEANQDIDDLEELLETANTFCNENPGVNRDEFVQEIKEYAELQGIE